jgi:hypothetical protein
MKKKGGDALKNRIKNGMRRLEIFQVKGVAEPLG